MAQLLGSDSFGQLSGSLRTSHIIRTRYPLSPLGEGELSECPVVDGLILAPGETGDEPVPGWAR